MPCQHSYVPAAEARNEQHNVFSVLSAPEGQDFSSKHTNVMKVERAVEKKKKEGGFTSQTREWQHLIFMRRVGADDSAARRRAARGGKRRALTERGITAGER